MLKKILVVIGLLFTINSLMAADVKQAKVVLKTDKQKISYAIGLDIGTKLKDSSDLINPEYLKLGLEDAINNRTFSLSDSEIKSVFDNYLKLIQLRNKKLIAELSNKNIKQEKAFLTKNKNKTGVITLASGLQYKVIKLGTGSKAKITDTVTTHYEGRDLDGNVFDSSYKRGEPATFTLKGVIPGWTEALTLMNEGAIWEIYIPSKLAYGEKGAGKSIEPNSALIFKIELLKIK